MQENLIDLLLKSYFIRSHRWQSALFKPITSPLSIDLHYHRPKQHWTCNNNNIVQNFNFSQANMFESTFKLQFSQTHA